MEKGQTTGNILFAFVVLSVAIVATIVVWDENQSPLNFCPDACDDCVHKVYITPETDIMACEIVWDKMSQGESPRFTGLIEQHFCNAYYWKGGGLGGEVESIGECGHLVIAGWGILDNDCNPKKDLAMQKDCYSTPEGYLYTYQIQNAVQFDYCVQEYYEQHFGGY